LSLAAEVSGPSQTRLHWAFSPSAAYRAKTKQTSIIEISPPVKKEIRPN
jgi:hypothetical protein